MFSWCGFPKDSINKWFVSDLLEQSWEVLENLIEFIQKLHMYLNHAWFKLDSNIYKFLYKLYFIGMVNSRVYIIVNCVYLVILFNHCHLIPKLSQSSTDRKTLKIRWTYTAAIQVCTFSYVAHMIWLNLNNLKFQDLKLLYIYWGLYKR